MAIAAAKERNPALDKYPLPTLGGYMIKAKMSAVIYDDSSFTGALNPQAKSLFTTRDTIVNITTDKIKSCGLKDNTPKADNKRDSKNKANKKYSIRRYMVIRLRKLSIK